MEKFIKAVEAGLAELKEISCIDSLARQNAEQTHPFLCEGCGYNGPTGCKFLVAGRALVSLITPDEAYNDIEEPTEAMSASEEQGGC